MTDLIDGSGQWQLNEIGTRQCVSACSGVPDLLAVIGGEVRFELIRLLAFGPMVVTDLASTLGLRQACTSAHLAELRRVDLVECRPDGKRRWYRLGSRLDAKVDGLCVTLQINAADGDSVAIETRMPFFPSPAADVSADGFDR